MSKRVGFWFFVGDWMKDPELRFCSLFARGLLMDLICLAFENSRQGEFSKPDGSPRSDDEIVNAISGGTRDQKLQALRELEISGVIKRRENTGVLYLKRIVELGEISEKRAAAKRGKGHKQKAARNQNDNKEESKPNQKEIKKGGVTVSVSDSDSDTDVFIHSEDNSSKNLSLEEKTMNERNLLCVPEIRNIDERLHQPFQNWLKFRFSIDGVEVPEIRQTELLMDLLRRGIEKAVRDIAFSIRVGAKNILDSNHDFQARKDDSSQQSYGQAIKAKVGI